MTHSTPLVILSQVEGERECGQEVARSRERERETWVVKGWVAGMWGAWKGSENR